MAWVDKYKEDDPETYKKIDPKNCCMADVFKKYALEDNTIDFVGHAVALHTCDDYVNKPAFDTIK